MRRVILQAIIITLASMAVGAVVNTVRSDVDAKGKPRRLSWVTPPPPELGPADLVGLEEAQQLWAEGRAIFLDARQPEDFAAGHIANAHNLPVDRFAEFYPEVAAWLTPDGHIIVYCDGEKCELSHRLMTQLRELGYRHVRVLHNGWTVWRRAGLPTATGAGR
ncbi:MAG: rhodanese-like domain-containing protein [Verrucomicrobiae bacterium]|nr:rhodanese-like domain-containing protein [Verrucomicrobiae bacterium]